MAAAVESLHAVTTFATGEEPGVPVILLGHSWGSMMAQRVADRWGGELGGPGEGTRAWVSPT